MTPQRAIGNRIGTLFYCAKKRRHEVTTLQRVTQCPEQESNLQPSD